VILLVHAGVCDSRMWDGFDLPGAERHEMRGFGDTPPPPDGEYSPADDLLAAIGDGPVALVGASFGGHVCLEVAARRPELVSELVLLGSPLFDHEWSEEMERFDERESELLQAGRVREAAELNADFWLEDASLRDRVIEMQERSFELKRGSEAELTGDDVVDLGAVTARTLVAVGELDKQDFRAIAERLAREIPGAEYAVVEGAGHVVALERPDETARLVRDFLRM
jgi:pimeloyl-ACP methyl ester carboxylesterase